MQINTRGGRKWDLIRKFCRHIKISWEGFFIFIPHERACTHIHKRFFDSQCSSSARRRAPSELRFREKTHFEGKKCRVAPCCCRLELLTLSRAAKKYELFSSCVNPSGKDAATSFLVIACMCVRVCVVARTRVIWRNRISSCYIEDEIGRNSDNICLGRGWLGNKVRFCPDKRIIGGKSVCEGYPCYNSNGRWRVDFLK